MIVPSGIGHGDQPLFLLMFLFSTCLILPETAYVLIARKADHIAVMIQNMKEEASSLLQYVFRSNVPKSRETFRGRFDHTGGKV